MTVRVGSAIGWAVFQTRRCWYHLQKRVYERLGALGLAKERRKLLEKEILGLLWRGRTAADRSKHREMSWTAQGVLAAALFAAMKKQKLHHLLNR